MLFGIIMFVIGLVVAWFIYQRQKQQDKESQSMVTKKVTKNGHATRTRINLLEKRFEEMLENIQLSSKGGQIDNISGEVGFVDILETIDPYNIEFTAEEKELLIKAMRERVKIKNVAGRFQVVPQKLPGFVTKITDILAQSVLEKTYDIFAAGERSFLHIIADPSLPPDKWLTQEKVLPADVRGVYEIEYSGQKYIALGYGLNIELRPIEEWDKQGDVYKIRNEKRYNPKDRGFYSIGLYDSILYASHSAIGGFLWDFGNRHKEIDRIPGGMEGGIRFSKIASTYDGPHIIYVENGHSIKASPLSKVALKKEVMNTCKDPSEHGIREVRALINHEDLICAGLYNGETYFIDPTTLHSSPGPRVPLNLEIRTLHSMNWLKQKYIVASQPKGTVIIFDPKNRSEYVSPHSNETKRFLDLASIPGYLLGVNGHMHYCWSLKETEHPITRNEWSGHYMSLCAIK